MYVIYIYMQCDLWTSLPWHSSSLPVVPSPHSHCHVHNYSSWNMVQFEYGNWVSPILATSSLWNRLTFHLYGWGILLNSFRLWSLFPLYAMSSQMLSSTLPLAMALSDALCCAGAVGASKWRKLLGRWQASDAASTMDHVVVVYTGWVIYQYIQNYI